MELTRSFSPRLGSLMQMARSIGTGLTIRTRTTPPRCGNGSTSGTACVSSLLHPSLKLTLLPQSLLDQDIPHRTIFLQRLSMRFCLLKQSVPFLPSLPSPPHSSSRYLPVFLREKACWTYFASLLQHFSLLPELQHHLGIHLGIEARFHVITDAEYVRVMRATKEEMERVGRGEREGYWEWREREARGVGEVVWREEEERWELEVGETKERRRVRRAVGESEED